MDQSDVYEIWPKKKLANVVELVMGQSPPGSTYNIDGDGMPFLQGKAEFGTIYPKHVKYTSKPMKVGKKGSILFSVRAPVGAVNIANIDYCIGRGLASISLKNGSNLFLFYLLQYLKNEIKKEGTGSTFKAITKDRLANFEIPLPPLKEQKNIAYILSTVREAIEKTEGVIKATKELKKSLMKHLFTYGPVPITEREQVQLKETEIGLVPEEWNVVKVNDVYEFSRKPKDLIISDEERIPFIPMEYISEENEIVDNWELKNKNEIKSGSFAFKDDLIIAKITPSFENGKQAILTNLPTQYCYTTTEIYALHPRDNRATTRYLYNYLKMEKIRKTMAGKMEGSTGRQRLPKRVIGDLLIPLPSFSEQQKIAKILLLFDEKINKEKNKIDSLEKLFKSLLENLMMGKLRVKDLNLGVLEN
ncbi:MAG: restriction endonuclease subunit S [Candidatus Heimdallarchaeaceae archaeon]